MLHTLLPLKPYRSAITLSSLAGDIRTTWSLIRRSPHWAPLAQEINRIAKSTKRPCALTLSEEVVSIDLPASVTPRGFEQLLRNLLPWRVGPYQIGPTFIDSEWRSFCKWQRLLPLLGDLQGARIADVGCSSGYFLFRLAALQPELLVGFDPIERCWLQFGLLQALAKLPNLAFVPSGIATVDGFPEFFDLVLCMGVIYHQRDPFTACKKLFAAVKPGGRVFLESLVLPEQGSHLLLPRERYAKMRNAWIVPTPEALETLLIRAGFSDAQVHTFGPVTSAEQRRTDWAPYESLADFLDPNDPTKTVEGYPAPHSALVVARKCERSAISSRTQRATPLSTD
jgi:tRNA (mo5U34)-methyltransferase